METIRCPHCGGQTRAAAAFCTVCGRKVRDAVTPPGVPPVPGPATPPGPAFPGPAAPQPAPVSPAPPTAPRARRPLPRWTMLVVLVALVIGALARGRGGGGGPPTPTPLPTARVTPSPPPQPASADDVLAKVKAPFPPELVPAGYSVQSQEEQQLTSEQRVDNLMAAILVDLSGPDLNNLIYFQVYPSQADAQSGLEHSGPSGTLTGNSRPDGFDRPVLCFTSTETFSDGVGNYGETNCLGRHVNVLVWGTSRVQSDIKAGNMDRATELLRAGLARATRAVDEARGERPPPP